ncbi:hypothetical protein POUND7_002574 [Theobroma cacao]
MNLCKTEESIVWYDLCQVQYSFQNSSLMVYTGKYPESNKQETNISHPDNFNDVLTFLMNNISTEAASLSKIMFGFGEIKFNKKETIYGLVQCSRDISGSNCQTCLDSALGDLKACCYSRTGGTVLSRNCNVRFQMYHFYNASNSPLIYPRSAGDKWSSGMLVAVICATALVLALLIGSSVVYYRWKKRTQKDEEISQKALLYELASPRGVTITQEGELKLVRQDMGHSSSTKTIRLLLLLLCSFLFGLHDLALADPPYAHCSNNISNNLLNSSFQNNLNNLLSLLHSQASISKYNNTSYGNGTDRVYGQYMCLDYVPYDTCQACISAASQAIVNLCRNRTEAVVWEEYCQLRYSDINFFGRLNVADNFFQDNVINISDPVHFQSIVENKLRDLTKRAAFNSSANMYAAGGEPYTGDDTLYAMVQCTRDLSPDNCSKCLEAAIKDVSSECYASRGARLLSRSCYLRYELYAFYEGAEDSSVSTKKEGGGGRKIWMIVVLTIGSAVLVILLLASTIYCVARKKGTGKGKEKILRNQMQIHNIGDPENTDLQNQYFEGLDELRAHDSYFDLATINSATDNFSDSKLLGQGGFGPVYKLFVLIP